MKVIAYQPSLAPMWDAAVRASRNGTFLFERAYMDYHSDRFEDVSLIALDKHDRPVALLPACVRRTQFGGGAMTSASDRVESHGGLTYGGLLLLPSATTVDTYDILKACLDYYRERGFHELIYKPVPHIYHTYPAEEDLYALFRLGARLHSRAVSSVIDLRAPFPFSTLRKRKVRKAEADETLTFCTDSAQLDAFWSVLSDVLQCRHSTRPVHTVEEMRRLMGSFPDEIRLITALSSNGASPHVVAGCLLFLTGRVAHVQYIAASDEGCRVGALDWLFRQTIALCQSEAPRRPWFDFGISTEQGGQLLNEGLIFQKEGFGGRAVCYDAYEVKLRKVIGISE